MIRIHLEQSTRDQLRSLRRKPLPPTAATAPAFPDGAGHSPPRFKFTKEPSRLVIEKSAALSQLLQAGEPRRHESQRIGLELRT